MAKSIVGSPPTDDHNPVGITDVATDVVVVLT